jgi:hypothetical protein
MGTKTGGLGQKNFIKHKFVFLKLPMAQLGNALYNRG